MRTPLLVALILVGCDNPDSEGHDGGGFDAAADAGLHDADSPDAADDAGPTFLTTLSSTDALAGLEGPTGDVKYLAPVAGVAPRAPITEPCYFQNMRVFDYHLLFLRSFAELSTLTALEYRDLVLRRPTRIWWGGGIKHYPATPHPFSGDGVTAWTVYHEVAGADRLVTDDLTAVHTILRECVEFSPEKLAFLPTDPYQVGLARQERANLAAQGIAVIFAEELR